MQDGIDALDQLVHGLLVRQVARHHFFAFVDGRGHVGDVRQANLAGERLEAFAQDFAKAASGTGQ
ncbi:hypothetical protein D3C85_1805710 [compost metagenome]